MIGAVTCNPKAFLTPYFLQCHYFHNLSGNFQPQNHGIPKVSEITVPKFENDHDLPRIDVLLNNIINGFKIFPHLQLSGCLRAEQLTCLYTFKSPFTRVEGYH